jgi:MFS family permease
MIAADAVRALVQAVIALAFFTDAIEIWHLALSSAIFGVASAFFGPASTGLVPEIVSANRLQEANALLGLSRNAIELFGPALSGVLVATVGYSLIYLIDAASFAASLVCLAAMQRRLRRLPPRQSFLADARDGLLEVARRPWLRVTLAVDAVTNFAIAPYLVLGPVVVREHLGGASDWGLMMTAAAAGGIIGGALALRWQPPRPLVPAYLLILLLPVALLMLVPPLPLAVLMLGSAGFTLSIVLANTFWTTMEQQHVPNEALGRVDSISWMVSLVIMPIGFVVTGPVSDAIGVRETLIAAAVIGTASPLAALASSSVRDLRRLEDGEPATAAPGPAAPSE